MSSYSYRFTGFDETGCPTLVVERTAGPRHIVASRFRGADPDNCDHLFAKARDVARRKNRFMTACRDRRGI